MQHGFLLPSNVVNKRAPLNRGLVSWWLHLPNRLGGGGNTFRDWMGQNHGTLTNGPTWKGRPGIWGSISFDGTNDYIATGDVSARVATEATFSIWVKLGANPSSGSPGAWYWNSCDFSSHYSYADGNIYDGTFRTTRQAVGAGLIPDKSVWHHVCITSKPGASGWTFYQNAAVAATATGDSSITLISAPTIGRSQDGTSVLGGNGVSPVGAWVDDIRLYNRCLTANEVGQLYRASAASYPNELNWQQRPVIGAQQAAATGGHLLRYRRMAAA